MKPKPVLVEWLDSRQPYEGWCRLRDIAEPEAVPIKSVGYIVRENAEAITLAQSLGVKPKQCMGMIVIPRCCIKKIVRLR